MIKRAFVLVETVIAMGILSTSALSIIYLNLVTQKLNNECQLRMQVLNIASNILEGQKKCPSKFKCYLNETPINKHFAIKKVTVKREGRKLTLFTGRYLE